MKYFTSDTHFGHANIIRYCSRPFTNSTEMNQVMLQNLQAVLTDEDDLYFLGDWCMDYHYFSLIKEVPFRRMVFVLGNHDRVSKLKKRIAADGLKDRVLLVAHTTVEIDGQTLFLVHQPIRGSDEMPTLCGHVHTRWRFQPAGTMLEEYKSDEEGLAKLLKQPVLNVGVDQHNFWPISEVEVAEFFSDPELAKAYNSKGT